MVEGVVAPRDRKEGAGTHPKAEADLCSIYYSLVGEDRVDEGTIRFWKKRILETSHYGSLHIITNPNPVEPTTKKFTALLFEREWERVDVELFGLHEAVITVVDRKLNETDPGAIPS